MEHFKSITKVGEKLLLLLKTLVSQITPNKQTPQNMKHPPQPKPQPLHIIFHYFYWKLESILVSYMYHTLNCEGPYSWAVYPVARRRLTKTDSRNHASKPSCSLWNTKCFLERPNLWISISKYCKGKCSKCAFL